MASNTIWSVDLGRSSLKAVKLRRDHQNIEIVAIDKIDYPLSKNGVDAVTHAKEALGIFRARNDVREPVAVTHPGQGTFSRFIKVPAFDDKKVKDMVGYEASQQIPFPLDEVIWDYHLLERDYLPGEEREVALFAVRREAIEDFLLDFTQESMVVDVVSIGYLGLLNFVIHDIAPEEPSIILDIGAAHTDLVLVDGRKFWIRPLPHSGNDITKAIMDRFKLSFNKAESLKIESTKVPQQAVKIFQAVIQPKLKELVSELHRSIGFYRSQAGEVKFTKLYLLGNGSKIIGIKKFLEEQLGVEVVRVQTIRHFRVNREVNLKLLQNDLPSFAATLGCGLQALGLGPCRVDLVPREEKLKKEVSRKKKHVFIAAGILFFVLLVARYGIIAGKLSNIEQANRQPEEISALIENKKILDRRQRGGGLQDFGPRMEELRRLTELRGRVTGMLQALDGVLTAFPNASGVEVVAQAGERAAVEEARREFTGKSLFEMLWVPWVEVELTTYPPPAESRRAGTQTTRTAAPGTVPAYNVRVGVAIKMRETAEESAAFIDRSFKKPLETALKVGNLSIKHGVNVHPGENVDEIPLARGAAGKGTIPEGQEGRPFYVSEVSWMLVPREPPPPEEKAAEPERTPSERRPPRTPRRP
jgi:type IV pilus assembly protein PilM